MPPNLGSVVSHCCRRVGGRSIGHPQARGFCSPPGSNELNGAGKAVGVWAVILRGIGLATGYGLGVILPSGGVSAPKFEEKLQKDLRETEEYIKQMRSGTDLVSDGKF